MLNEAVGALECILWVYNDTKRDAPLINKLIPNVMQLRARWVEVRGGRDAEAASRAAARR